MSDVTIDEKWANYWKGREGKTNLTNFISGINGQEDEEQRIAYAIKVVGYLGLIPGQTLQRLSALGDNGHTLTTSLKTLACVVTQIIQDAWQKTILVNADTNRLRHCIRDNIADGCARIMAPARSQYVRRVLAAVIEGYQRFLCIFMPLLSDWGWILPKICRPADEIALYCMVQYIADTEQMPLTKSIEQHVIRFEFCQEEFSGLFSAETLRVWAARYPGDVLKRPMRDRPEGEPPYKALCPSAYKPPEDAMNP